MILLSLAPPGELLQFFALVVVHLIGALPFSYTSTCSRAIIERPLFTARGSLDGCGLCEVARSAGAIPPLRDFLALLSDSRRHLERF